MCRMDTHGRIAPTRSAEPLTRQHVHDSPFLPMTSSMTSWTREASPGEEKRAAEIFRQRLPDALGRCRAQRDIPGHSRSEPRAEGLPRRVDGTAAGQLQHHAESASDRRHVQRWIVHRAGLQPRAIGGIATAIVRSSVRSRYGIRPTTRLASRSPKHGDATCRRSRPSRSLPLSSRTSEETNARISFSHGQRSSLPRRQAIAKKEAKPPYPCAARSPAAIRSKAASHREDAGRVGARPAATAQFTAWRAGFRHCATFPGDYGLMFPTTRRETDRTI